MELNTLREQRENVSHHSEHQISTQMDRYIGHAPKGDHITVSQFHITSSTIYSNTIQTASHPQKSKHPMQTPKQCNTNQAKHKTKQKTRQETALFPAWCRAKKEKRRKGSDTASRLANAGAAVDDNLLAVGPARHVGGEPDGRPDYVAGHAEAAERVLLLEPAAYLHVLDDVLDHLGLHDAGRQGVAAHAEARQALGARAHQLADAGGGGREVGLLGTGVGGGRGRHADDGVVGVLGLGGVGGQLEELALELAGAGLDEVEVAVEVDFDVAAQQLGRDVEEVAVPAHAGVADGDVEAAVGLDGAAHNVLGRARVGDVAEDDGAALAERADFDAERDDFLVGRVVLGAPVVGDDVGALAGEADGDGTADAARRARDGADLALEQARPQRRRCRRLGVDGRRGRRELGGRGLVHLHAAGHVGRAGGGGVGLRVRV